MNKVLSIIVPSYNMEKYLPKCLGSLLIKEQDLFQKLDVIVVNDGSKDRTSEIAHEYAVKFPGVFRVIDKTNGHYGSCVNAAIPIVNGTYVKLLDADDYVSTEAFALFTRLADQESRKGDEGADLLVSNYQQVDEQGNVTAQIDYSLNETHGYYSLDDYTDYLNRFAVHSVAYRTENVRRMGYHQTEGINYTDTEWIIEPMTKVRRFLFQKVPVSCYLVGREGQSMNDATYKKKFQHELDIALKLARNYKSYYSSATRESREYYKNEIFLVIKNVFSHMFWNLRGKEHVCADFVSFDKSLKSVSPELYTYSDGISLTIQKIPWKYWPLFYVKEWRKHYSIHTFRFMLYGKW